MPPPEPPKPSRREGLKNILSTVLILVAAPLIALTLTAFVFQSYEVDGPSMETTLQNKDRLVVLKIGKTWDRIWGNDFIPKRGEIVIFSQDDAEGGRQLIKRVVGLPGERVVVKNGQITIYNKQFPQGFNPDQDQKFRDQIDVNTPGDIDTVIPPGEVFVCGDNRNNSLDSRSFGPIAAKDIVGTLAMRIYPFGKLKTF
jgi:signal peptidase I